MAKKKTTIIIEDGVELPHHLNDNVMYLNALTKLGLKQSFKFPASDYQKVTIQLRKARKDGKIFSTRRINDLERRVWRIK